MSKFQFRYQEGIDPFKQIEQQLSKEAVMT